MIKSNPQNYSLLLLGNFYDYHMMRFVKNLKKENPNAVIDAFTPSLKGRNLSDDYLNCYRECRMVSFFTFFSKVPLIREIENILNWYRYFHIFAKDHRYNVINIHYPSYVMWFILKDLKKIADKMVITPWGSDVYRIGCLKRAILKRVYNAADYVTGQGNRFTGDFLRIFNAPKQKLVYAYIGSDLIDYIVKHQSHCKPTDAKILLGIEDNYVITCGYNASESQQHLKIIESIGRVRHELPNNLVLIFPVTYPKRQRYVDTLKKAVEDIGVRALFFTDYLELEQLFIVRQATDMFIHIQTTDANSASVKEYLLLGKNCICGSWLVYDDVEDVNYKPYHSVDSIKKLSVVIAEAYHEGSPKIKDDVIRYIVDLGWSHAAKSWNNLYMSISK